MCRLRRLVVGFFIFLQHLVEIKSSALTHKKCLYLSGCFRCEYFWDGLEVFAIPPDPWKRIEAVWEWYRTTLCADSTLHSQQQLFRRPYLSTIFFYVIALHQFFAVFWAAFYFLVEHAPTLFLGLNLSLKHILPQLSAGCEGVIKFTWLFNKERLWSMLLMYFSGPPTFPVISLRLGRSRFIPADSASQNTHIFNCDPVIPQFIYFVLKESIALMTRRHPPQWLWIPVLHAIRIMS